MKNLLIAAVTGVATVLGLEVYRASKNKKSLKNQISTDKASVLTGIERVKSQVKKVLAGKKTPIEYWIKVAGTTFENRQEVLKALTNEPLMVKPATKEGFKDAFEICTANAIVGYVPKNEVAKWHKRINKGYKVSVTQYAKHGGNTPEKPRVGLGVKVRFE